MTLYAAEEPLLIVCPGCGSIVETVGRRREPQTGVVETLWPSPPRALSCCGDLERPGSGAVDRANDRRALRIRARRPSH